MHQMPVSRPGEEVISTGHFVLRTLDLDELIQQVRVRAVPYQADLPELTIRFVGDPLHLVPALFADPAQIALQTTSDVEERRRPTLLHPWTEIGSVPLEELEL